MLRVLCTVFNTDTAFISVITGDTSACLFTGSRGGYCVNVVFLLASMSCLQASMSCSLASMSFSLASM